MHLWRKCHVNMELFCHNLTDGSKQKYCLTKVIEEYALMKEMPCKSLYMEYFGQNMFILSQEILQQEWESWILACKIFELHIVMCMSALRHQLFNRVYNLNTHLCCVACKTDYKNLAREDTRLPFMLKELLWRNQHFVTKWFHI